MRVTWAALPFAVAAFGLAACGDDDKGDSGGGTSDGAYPAEVRENFLKACQASGGEEAKCECAFKRIEDRVSFADFKQVDADVRAGKSSEGKTADVIADAVKSCA